MSRISDLTCDETLPPDDDSPVRSSGQRPSIQPSIPHGVIQSTSQSGGEIANPIPVRPVPIQRPVATRPSAPPSHLGQVGNMSAIGGQYPNHNPASAAATLRGLPPALGSQAPSKPQGPFAMIQQQNSLTKKERKSAEQERRRQERNAIEDTSRQARMREMEDQYLKLHNHNVMQQHIAASLLIRGAPQPQVFGQNLLEAQSHHMINPLQHQLLVNSQRPSSVVHFPQPQHPPLPEIPRSQPPETSGGTQVVKQIKRGGGQITAPYSRNRPTTANEPRSPRSSMSANDALMMHNYQRNNFPSQLNVGQLAQLNVQSQILQQQQLAAAQAQQEALITPQISLQLGRGLDHYRAPPMTRTSSIVHPPQRPPSSLNPIINHSLVLNAAATVDPPAQSLLDNMIMHNNPIAKIPEVNRMFAGGPSSSASPFAQNVSPKPTTPSLATPSPRPSILRRKGTDQSVAKRRLGFTEDPSQPQQLSQPLLQSNLPGLAPLPKKLKMDPEDFEVKAEMATPPPSSSTEATPRKRQRKQQFDHDTPAVEAIETPYEEYAASHSNYYTTTRRRRGRPPQVRDDAVNQWQKRMDDADASSPAVDKHKRVRAREIKTEVPSPVPSFISAGARKQMPTPTPALKEKLPKKEKKARKENGDKGKKALTEKKRSEGKSKRSLEGDDPKKLRKSESKLLLKKSSKLHKKGNKNQSPDDKKPSKKKRKRASILLQRKKKKQPAVLRTGSKRGKSKLRGVVKVRQRPKPLTKEKVAELKKQFFVGMGEIYHWLKLKVQEQDDAQEAEVTERIDQHDKLAVHLQLDRRERVLMKRLVEKARLLHRKAWATYRIDYQRTRNRREARAFGWKAWRRTRAHLAVVKERIERRRRKAEEKGLPVPPLSQLAGIRPKASRKKCSRRKKRLHLLDKIEPIFEEKRPEQYRAKNKLRRPPMLKYGRVSSVLFVRQGMQEIIQGSPAYTRLEHIDKCMRRGIGIIVAYMQRIGETSRKGRHWRKVLDIIHRRRERIVRAARRKHMRLQLSRHQKVWDKRKRRKARRGGGQLMKTFVRAIRELSMVKEKRFIVYSCGHRGVALRKAKKQMDAQLRRTKRRYNALKRDMCRKYHLKRTTTNISYPELEKLYLEESIEEPPSPPPHHIILEHGDSDFEDIIIIPIVRKSKRLPEVEPIIADEEKNEQMENAEALDNEAAGEEADGPENMDDGHDQDEMGDDKSHDMEEDLEDVKEEQPEQHEHDEMMPSCSSDHHDEEEEDERTAKKKATESVPKSRRRGRPPKLQPPPELHPQNDAPPPGVRRTSRPPAPKKMSDSPPLTKRKKVETPPPILEREAPQPREIMHHHGTRGAASAMRRGAIKAPESGKDGKEAVEENEDEEETQSDKKKRGGAKRTVDKKEKKNEKQVEKPKRGRRKASEAEVKEEVNEEEEEERRTPRKQGRKSEEKRESVESKSPRKCRRTTVDTYYEEDDEDDEEPPVLSEEGGSKSSRSGTTRNGRGRTSAENPGSSKQSESPKEEESERTRRGRPKKPTDHKEDVKEEESEDDQKTEGKTTGTRGRKKKTQNPPTDSEEEEESERTGTPSDEGPKPKRGRPKKEDKQKEEERVKEDEKGKRKDEQEKKKAVAKKLEEEKKAEQKRKEEEKKKTEQKKAEDEKKKEEEKRKAEEDKKVELKKKSEMKKKDEELKKEAEKKAKIKNESPADDSSSQGSEKTESPALVFDTPMDVEEAKEILSQPRGRGRPSKAYQQAMHVMQERDNNPDAEEGEADSASHSSSESNYSPPPRPVRASIVKVEERTPVTTIATTYRQVMAASLLEAKQAELARKKEEEEAEANRKDSAPPSSLSTRRGTFSGKPTTIEESKSPKKLQAQGRASEEKKPISKPSNASKTTDPKQAAKKEINDGLRGDAKSPRKVVKKTDVKEEPSTAIKQGKETKKTPATNATEDNASPRKAGRPAKENAEKLKEDKDVKKASSADPKETEQGAVRKVGRQTKQAPEKEAKNGSTPTSSTADNESSSNGVRKPGRPPKNNSEKESVSDKSEASKTGDDKSAAPRKGRPPKNLDAKSNDTCRAPEKPSNNDKDKGDPGGKRGLGRPPKENGGDQAQVRPRGRPPNSTKQTGNGGANNTNASRVKDHEEDNVRAQRERTALLSLLRSFRQNCRVYVDDVVLFNCTEDAASANLVEALLHDRPLLPSFQCVQAYPIILNAEDSVKVEENKENEDVEFVVKIGEDVGPSDEDVLQDSFCDEEQQGQSRECSSDDSGVEVDGTALVELHEEEPTSTKKMKRTREERRAELPDYGHIGFADDEADEMDMDHAASHCMYRKRRRIMDTKVKEGYFTRIVQNFRDPLRARSESNDFEELFGDDSVPVYNPLNSDESEDSDAYNANEASTSKESGISEENFGIHLIPTRPSDVKWSIVPCKKESPWIDGDEMTVTLKEHSNVQLKHVDGVWWAHELQPNSEDNKSTRSIRRTEARKTDVETFLERMRMELRRATSNCMHFDGNVNFPFVQHLPVLQDDEEGYESAVQLQEEEWQSPTYVPMSDANGNSRLHEPYGNTLCEYGSNEETVEMDHIETVPAYESAASAEPLNLSLKEDALERPTTPSPVQMTTILDITTSPSLVEEFVFKVPRTPSSKNPLKRGADQMKEWNEEKEKRPSTPIKVSEVEEEEVKRKNKRMREKKEKRRKEKQVHEMEKFGQDRYIMENIVDRFKLVASPTEHSEDLIAKTRQFVDVRRAHIYRYLDEFVQFIGVVEGRARAVIEEGLLRQANRVARSIDYKANVVGEYMMGCLNGFGIDAELEDEASVRAHVDVNTKISSWLVQVMPSLSEMEYNICECIAMSNSERLRMICETYHGVIKKLAEERKIGVKVLHLLQKSDEPENIRRRRRVSAWHTYQMEKRNKQRMEEDKDTQKKTHREKARRARSTQHSFTEEERAAEDATPPPTEEVTLDSDDEDFNAKLQMAKELSMQDLPGCSAREHALDAHDYGPSSSRAEMDAVEGLLRLGDNAERRSRYEAMSEFSLGVSYEDDLRHALMASRSEF